MIKKLLLSALTLILIISLISCYGSGAESVLNKYLDALYGLDFNKALPYCAYNFNGLWDEMRVSEGITEEEFMNTLFEYYGVKNMSEYLNYRQNETLIFLKEDLGGDFKITSKIINKYVLPGSDTADIIDDLMEEFDSLGLNIYSIIQADKITEMIEFDVELTFSGSNYTETYEDVFTCVKIDGKWYVLDYEILDMLIFLY